MQGFIHVYTGNGKGKTTAAFGLALRAAGAGKKVFIAQFVKGKSYGEIEAARKFLPAISIRQYGRGCFIFQQPEQADITAARNGLEDVARILAANQHQLIILDEACIALYYKLFSLEDFMNVIRMRAPGTELVVTGRYAPSELIDMADLVTEMKEVKHYYTKGVEAREGIEF